MLEYMQQVSDPGHVFIKTASGGFVCHGKAPLGLDDNGKPNPSDLEGKPIRFTKLAAERRLASRFGLYLGATTVEAK